MPRSEYPETMGPTITLPAVVDLAAADTLLVTLRQSLAAHPACRLDASNVEKLMLPGMQVILAAIRSSEQVEVVDPSASFCAAFDDAALSWARDKAAGHDAPARSQPAQEGEGRADAPPTVKRILTIDDSKTMRDMLRFTLVDAGYEVIQAVDGQDGLDVLTRERVDVVITDINMPRLDGYGVIRHLRADAGYDETPILVLSTEGDQNTRNIGRDAGATGWLVKPFDPGQLVEIVRQVSP